MPDCLEYIELQERLIEIEDDLLSKNSLLSIKNINLSNKQSELASIDSSIDSKLNQIESIKDQIIIKEADLMAIEKQIIDLNYDPFLAAILTIQKQQKQRELTDLNALINEFTGKTRAVYCADYTEGLTGDVGLCDVPGEEGDIVIYPDFEGQSVYNRTRDGIIKPLAAINNPYSAAYNLMSQAAIRKWKPIYRKGTITGINKETDIATVSLSSANMGIFQVVDVNQSTSFTDIPVVYMDCNAAAFEVGDTVLIKFSPHDWDNPAIVGFMNNPKQCCTAESCEAAFLSGPVTITEGNTGVVTLSEEKCRPYLWSITGVDWLISESETQLPENIVTAGCGEAEILCNMSACETTTVKSLIIDSSVDCVCTETECAAWAWGDNPETADKDDEIVISVVGGCAPYKWTIEGEGWSLAKTITLINENVLTVGCGTGKITCETICGKLDDTTEGGGVRSSSGMWVYKSSDCRLPGNVETLLVYGQFTPGFKFEKILNGKRQIHYQNTSGGDAICPDSNPENCYYVPEIDPERVAPGYDLNLACEKCLSFNGGRLYTATGIRVVMDALPEPCVLKSSTEKHDIELRNLDDPTILIDTLHVIAMCSGIFADYGPEEGILLQTGSLSYYEWEPPAEGCV